MGIAIKKRNVLLFPAGSEIGLEIHRSLSMCKEVNLFGAGQDVSNHARFIYKKYHLLKSVHEEGWLGQLSALCGQLHIDYIFPGHDDAIVALALNQDNIPARVITSPTPACVICRSKSKTYDKLSNLLKVPKLFSSPSDVSSYPVFVKPDSGQGSQGVVRVSNEYELAYNMKLLNDPIICEYLPGDEFTVDCFSDRDQGLLFYGARTRGRIRNGISVNTRTIDLPGANEFAEIIGKTLRMRGAWFFQLKRAADGKLVLLEVAPRIAGAMAVHRAMGVNFPLLSLFEEERQPISILTNNGSIEMDRALNSVRYKMSIEYSSLYIDLDDTLILHGQLNSQAMLLIHMCVEAGKKVHLLTRHRGDIRQTLKQHRISELFDTVNVLPETAKKSNYVKDKNSIFVDDSFSERLEVSAKCSIPTFDCGMIEALINRVD